MPWDNTPDKRQRDSRVYGARWRRKRDECLKRARWRCEIKLDGICIGAASEVDHIDGAENDPNHERLRAACTPCHRAITAQQGGGFRSKAAPDPEPRPRTAW